jgi:hypothetical protein
LNEITSLRETFQESDMPAIYPVFEKSRPDSVAFNGNSLSRCLPQLDEMAVAIKVTPLSRFIDSHTMAHEVLDEEAIAALPVPPVKWLEPEEGLLTVRGILREAEQTNAHFHSRRDDDTDTVLRELKELERLLVSAADEANRFHLLVEM